MGHRLSYILRSGKNTTGRQIQDEITLRKRKTKAVDVRMNWTQSIIWTNSDKLFSRGAETIFFSD
jgi:hypothetical protein